MSRHPRPCLLVLPIAVAAILCAAPVGAAAAPPTLLAGGGEEAGQVNLPSAVAVDQQTGTIFVAEQNDRRIDEFEADGTFLRAFGWGVRDGAGELQVCTTSCREGLPGTGAGELDPRGGLAVDEDPSSPSYGDVYVDEVAGYRIQEFTPAGAFVEMFGTGVDHTTGANVCTAASGDVCGSAVKGSGPGGIDVYNPPLAVAADGDVLLGDEGRIERFSHAGEYLTEIPATAGKEVLALALDPGGDIFYIAGSGGLHPEGPVVELGPSGEPLRSLDAGGHPNALAIEPASGDLFVADQLEPGQRATRGSAHLLRYAADGTELESFGKGQVLGGPIGDTLAWNSRAGRLLVASVWAVESGTPESAVQSFAVPPPGPLILEGSEVAEGVGKTAATLTATVIPEGVATSVTVEYLTQAAFEAEGWGAGSLLRSAPTTIGAGFEEEPVKIAVAGLAPETSYRFRTVAQNGEGTAVGTDGATFATRPPLRIDSTFATEVGPESALLGAELEPLGEVVDWRFEYLSEAAYEANLTASREPFTGAVLDPMPDGTTDASEAGLVVSAMISGLEPHTAYVFRLAASDAAAPLARFGRTARLTTTIPGGGTAMLDDRAWEMVSPIEKDGGGISGIDQGTSLAPLQAAAGGEAITFNSMAAFAGAPGSPPANQYIAHRSSSGWQTEGIGIPINSWNFLELAGSPFKVFGPELEVGLLANGQLERNEPTPPLPGTEAEYGKGNFYLRSAAGGFQAIVREADAGQVKMPLSFEDGAPDLRHLLFADARGNLYEWSEAGFELVSVLPGQDGPAADVSGPGDGNFAQDHLIHDPRAISADGTRVVWSTRATEAASIGHRLYLREGIGGPDPRTVQIDASEGGSQSGEQGDFLGSSRDDSKIYFTDPRRLTPDSTASGECNPEQATNPTCGDLYRYEPEAPEGHRLTDLTVDPSEAGGAQVQGVLGVSEDGAYVYFVARGVLATNANAEGEVAEPGDCDTAGLGSGRCNLYVFHEGEPIRFIARLSGEDDATADDGEDVVNTFSSLGDWTPGIESRTTRVGADGRHLLFMSHASLTGYDNTVAGGGHCGETLTKVALSPRCPEVYLYEAPAGSGQGSLACVSCNPSGGRPTGPSGIPAGTLMEQYGGLYDSRALSADSRRVFFDSYDSLVPADTNGRLDVYEWEAPGEGTCNSSDAAFVVAAHGCLGLISAGTGEENSSFADASADGRDVFFVTSASLVPQDPGSIDLYDAREGGGLPGPAAPPLPCEGDTCRPWAAGEPEAPPASSTWSGAEAAPAQRGSRHRDHRRHRRRRHHRRHAGKAGRHLRHGRSGR